MLHDLFFTAVGTNRKPSTDDLSECGQVGLHFEKVLSSSVHEAECRDDFIIDHKGAGFVSDIIDGFEETFLRLDDPEVSYNRLDKNGCDLVAPFFHRFFERSDFIEWNGDHFLGDAFRYAC